MEGLPIGHHIKNFFQENLEYDEVKPSNLSAIVELGDIDELEDELWILQCPKGTDVTELQSQKIKLPGRTHLYEMEAVAVEFPAAVKRSFGYCDRKGKYGMRLLSVHGGVVLRKRLKANEMLTTEKLESISPAMPRVPVPDCIKLRHPLLGAQFTEKLTLDKATVERLRSADEMSTKILRQTRKNKRFDMVVKIEREKDQICFMNKKLREKRKYSSSETDDFSEKKKSKKSKRKACNEKVSDDLRWLHNL